MVNRIIEGDCIDTLKEMPLGNVSLIYIDPPFNTGKDQTRGLLGYPDSQVKYQEWLLDRVEWGMASLSMTGSFFIHLDHHEVHYVKVALDKLFGRERFMNEIIWSYDYGGRPKTKWPTKHDTILWYVMDPKKYTFNYDAIDRIPYMAPGLVGPEKAEKGKTPTDVWWNTIVHTNGKEKTGYPTQKPLAILERIVKVHSNPGEMCLDFFAGSGSFGEAAAKHGRNFTLIDSNPDAVEIMKTRLAKYL